MPLLRPAGRGLLIIVLAVYTAFAGGPFLWVAILSLRTTTEIYRNPYGLPFPPHFGKFADAWVGSNYQVYFLNSLVVVFGAVAIVTLIGAMAAHCLARYGFRGNRAIYFLLFSALIFPPQVTIIALFQILISYGLFDTRIGLILVYVALQLPITLYILETFFRRIPSDLFDAARMDGYSESLIFWRISLPVAWPAVSTTIIVNTILLWNEFLFAIVLISSDDRRTLPIGILKFMGDQSNDVGMIATGLMIAIVPVVAIYVFFSEKLIQGMTAGAVK